MCRVAWSTNVHMYLDCMVLIGSGPSSAQMTWIESPRRETVYLVAWVWLGCTTCEA
eukprot:IDg20572t1